MLRTNAAAAAAVNVMYVVSSNKMFRRAALESVESLSSCVTHHGALCIPFLLPARAARTIQLFICLFEHQRQMAQATYMPVNPQLISRTLFVGAQRNLAALGVWSIETYSPHFVNFFPGSRDTMWRHVGLSVLH